ncbi:IS66 family insertion sequence hypothetical protein (plasmid) [Ralstonia solanacearum]|uniref:IS66-like element accessory protein TnpA n=1 Tax=Ralstonia pseudosolanacearum TaxID=1310165 RepID=UPI00083D2604|nr:hypothetical protein [Ralstonia pseudosolanacearum]AOE91773.1 hypothetical protein LBM341_03522 [Ralstonia solanacearum]AOE92208.1 hypothetical protein LBM341_03958 [Ralstonia solanacearum]AOE92705.1 hypothetical protein LBM341_04456 [Ralstonia solanacearum]AXW58968.1 IS66 family insertion sequence hypothetical protein [Ralstonia solanacearum]AXW60479.1 IS66 family insertion sequence hypothetical protein [Ralstonia solanacearum]
MTDEEDLSYLPLKVTHVEGNGRRVFDVEAKRRLIEACRRPGVSISGMALKAGVNANQLHKWIRGRGCGPALATAGDSGSELVLPAFMPVVAIDDVVVPAPEVSKPLPIVHDPSPRAAASARLTAQLPNGARVELECDGRDVGLVKAMIEALGAR